MCVIKYMFFHSFHSVDLKKQKQTTQKQKNKNKKIPQNPNLIKYIKKEKLKRKNKTQTHIKP